MLSQRQCSAGLRPAVSALHPATPGETEDRGLLQCLATPPNHPVQPPPWPRGLLPEAWLLRSLEGLVVVSCGNPGGMENPQQSGRAGPARFSHPLGVSQPAASCFPLMSPREGGAAPLWAHTGAPLSSARLRPGLVPLGPGRGPGRVAEGGQGGKTPCSSPGLGQVLPEGGRERTCLDSQVCAVLSQLSQLGGEQGTRRAVWTKEMRGLENPGLGVVLTCLVNFQQRVQYPSPLLALRAGTGPWPPPGHRKPTGEHRPAAPTPMPAPQLCGITAQATAHS